MTAPPSLKSAINFLLRTPALVVFTLALILRGFYYGEISDTVLWQWERWNQSDMDTFLRVAGQILGGDLLAREPYRPLHGWHLVLGTPEEWSMWTNPHSFYHISGYYYLLALLLKVTGGSLTAVKVIQMVLGALHAALLSLVGLYLMGRLAGLLVGLLAASYGPLIALEPFLLRDGIGAFLATLSFYLVLRASRSSSERVSRLIPAWLAAGLTLGMAALMKETAFVLFAAVWLWILARSWRNASRLNTLAPVVLLLGFTLGLSPFIVRNLMVGVPPLGSSPNLAVTLMVGTAADVPDGGVIFFKDAPSFKGILRQSHAHLLPTLALTLRTYEDQPARFLSHLWGKFSALWSNLEAPDNFNYEHVELHVPLLRALPRFAWVWIPALTGLVLLGIIWSATRPGSRAFGRRMVAEVRRDALPFPRDALGLLLLIIGLQALILSFPPIIMRYRIIMVPFLMLLAGWTLAQGMQWLRHRRWTALSLWGGVLLTITLTWQVWPTNPILSQYSVRTNYVETAAYLLASQNDFAGAREEFDLAIGYFESHGQPEWVLLLRRDRLVSFTKAGHFSDVLDDWRLLTRISPDDPALEEVSEYLRAKLNSLE